jgi:hypothetical protein
MKYNNCMFDLSRYPYQKQAKVYRLYKAGYTPVNISKECGFNISTFVKGWSQTVIYLGRKFESQRVSTKRKPKGWRKLKIDADTLNRIRLYAETGRTREQICALLGLGRDTLVRYQKENPEIDEVIRFGHEDAMSRIERAIAKRAEGTATTKETKFFAYQGEVRDERTVTVHYPPDPSSAALVLVNKRGWRSGSSTVPTGDGDKGKILSFIEELANESESQTE